MKNILIGDCIDCPFRQPNDQGYGTCTATLDCEEVRRKVRYAVDNAERASICPLPVLVAPKEGK